MEINFFKQSCIAQLLVIVLLFNSNGYTQQPQWYIKNTKTTTPYGSTSRIIDFRNSPPTISGTGNLLTDHGIYEIYGEKEADNAIYDDNGNLEVFIAHDEVFDASGTNINRLVKANSSTFSNPSNDLNDYDLGICRVPLSCTKYYVFRYSRDGTVYRLTYYIYDISIHAFVDASGTPYPQISNSSIGHVPGIDLGAPQVNPNGELSNYNLSISKLNSSNERFLFFDNEQGVSIARITSTGVTYSPYPWSINHNSGYLHPKQLSTNYLLNTTYACETEVVQLSDGTYRVTRTSESEGTTSIYVIHVDDNGLVNSANSYDVFNTGSHVKGLEFSPDGNYLYISQTSPPYLRYVDITSQSNLVHDLDLPSGHNNNIYKENFKIGSIEMGHDGKMYFAGVNGISSFSDPNNPQNASISANWIDNDIAVDIDPQIDYQPNGTPYPIEQHLIPLPEQVDGEQLYTPITAGPFIGCGNSIPTGCVEEYSGFEYRWYDSGVHVASGACFTPTSFGSYDLVVIDENKCQKTYRVIFKNDFPNIPLLSDIVYCSVSGTPEALGWFGEHAFMSDVTGIDWTVNGDPIQTGPIDFQIPFLFNGIYTATVYTACGSQTLTFNVNDLLIEYVSHPYANVTHTQFPFSVNFSRTNSFPGPFSHEWHITQNNISHPTFYSNSVNLPYSIGDVFNVLLIVKDNVNCKTYRRSSIWSPASKSPKNNNEIELGFSAEIYPNPINDVAKLVVVNGKTEWYQLRIINMDGKVVSEKQTQYNSEIDFSELSRGTYLVEVFNEFENTTIKVVKE